MKCDICKQEFLPTDTQMGHGDGTGQRFAHEVCYYRERANKFETVLKYIRDDMLYKPVHFDWPLHASEWLYRIKKVL